ncbi:MAG: 30S ribosomal protein S20 [Gammaproteobacteria bacterium]|nr:30S ribosomal protein S20 [Gammaproteobacteria bacterium]MDE2024713.1 30S ribosomal protein S20 [Gammaproteobacteria bacterium]
MANTKQSKKRARQSVVHREHNAPLRSMVRSHIKKVAKLTAQGKKAEAETAYKEAVPVIDRMADKGLIHRNKAARHKSRLNEGIRAIKA